MHFGRLTVITGLAVEAWLFVAVIGSGLQLLVLSVAG